jgi:hypothetical protein
MASRLKDVIHRQGNPAKYWYYLEEQYTQWALFRAKTIEKKKK